MKNKSTLLVIGLYLLFIVTGATAKQDKNSTQGSFVYPSSLSLIYNIQIKGTGGEQIIRTSDGGSLISSYLNRIQRVITKLSSDGNIEWEQTLGTNYIIEINDLVEIPDVGYEAIGYLYLTDYPFMNANCRYVVRFNLKGEITDTWHARTKDKNALKSCNNQITRCADGTYITLYDLYHQEKSLVPYFWRYDTDGNLINEAILDTIPWSTFYVGTLLQIPDGGFGVLIIGKDSNGIGGKMELWRLDKNGKKIWSKAIDSWNTVVYTSYSSMTLTSDGGFAVATFNSVVENDTSYTVLRKFDNNGNQIFSKKYAISLWNAPTQIVETLSGDLFIAGFTQNNDAYHFEPNASDYFIIKTSSNGKLLWKDSFGDANSGDRVKSLSVVDDHTILISGFTGLLNNNSPVTTSAVTLKLTDLTSSVSEQPAVSDGITISPNPTSTSFTISGLEGVSSLRIMNSLGMEVSRKEVVVGGKCEVDVSALASGVYFVQFRSQTGVVSKSIVVSH